EFSGNKLGKASPPPLLTAGQPATGDLIGVADITAGANATVGYSGNNSPGTLTMSDGTHTANIALLGNYLASTLTASSNGLGGMSLPAAPVLDGQFSNQV